MVPCGMWYTFQEDESQDFEGNALDPAIEGVHGGRGGRGRGEEKGRFMCKRRPNTVKGHSHDIIDQQDLILS